MSLRLIVIIIINILTFFYSSKTSHASLYGIRNFSPFIEEVRNLYRSSGVTFIHPENNMDWEDQKIILNSIKYFSHIKVSSQSITRDQLAKAVELEMNSTTSPLFVLFVNEPQDFEYFRAATSKGRLSARLVWLLLMADRSDLNCEKPQGNPMGLDVQSKVLVRCFNSSRIRRYYSRVDNKTVVADVAVWQDNSKLDVIDWKRLFEPFDLKGVTVRVAKFKNEGFVTKTNLYLEAFLKDLMQMGGFKINVTLETTRQGYFNYTSNEYYGVIQFIKNNGADIGLFLTSMTLRRSKYVEFAVSLTKGRYRIYVKLPETPNINWTSYFKVFTPDVWILMIIMMIIILTCILIIKYYIKQNSPSFYNVPKQLFYIWTIYCQQHIAGSSFFSNRLMKIIYLTAFLLAVNVYYIYSAAITSYITILTKKLPFTNYKEFFNHADYKVLTLKYTADEYLADPNFWLKEALESKMVYDDINKLPRSSHDGLKMVCNDDIGLFMNRRYFKEESNEYLCPISTIKVPLTERMSIILPKNSPYKKILNRMIIRLHELGIIEKLNKQYITNKPEKIDNQTIHINLYQVLPILVIWMIGVIISLIILSVEILIHKKQLANQRRRKRLFTIRPTPFVY